MKIILCPSPVKVPVLQRTPEGMIELSKEIDICAFLHACLDEFPIFSKGHKNARLYDKLCRIVEAGPKDGKLEFEDQDYPMVADSVKAIEWATPKINRAYLPYYDAVQNATEEVKK